MVEGPDGIVGGAGIYPLNEADGNLCELQKMYFLKEARGIGLGRAVLNRCVEQAREFGYDGCFLDTLGTMKDAIKLYERFGFERVEKPLGRTGHLICDAYFYLPLKAD